MLAKGTFQPFRTDSSKPCGILYPDICTTIEDLKRPMYLQPHTHTGELYTYHTLYTTIINNALSQYVMHYAEGMIHSGKLTPKILYNQFAIKPSLHFQSVIRYFVTIIAT